MTKQQYEQARAAGRYARQAGKKRDACPIFGMGEDGQLQREAWHEGWEEADGERRVA